MASTWEEISKTEWRSGSEEDSFGAREKTKVGALQRIADATELMAKNYRQLQNDRDLYERWYRDGEKTRKQLLASNVALRGVITRMKRRAIANGQ